MEPLTLKAARYYARRGLPVFPLNGKIPITDHGVKDATLDDQQIVEWFTHHHNIGIAIPAGVVVADIDPRNGGDRTLNNWCATHGIEWLDNVPRAHTGGNGTHYWYRYDGRPLRKAIDGIDFQRTGKYVVAPPSTTAGPYTWEIPLPADLDELPELPDWLLELATIEQVTLSPSARDYTGDDELNTAAYEATTWSNVLGGAGWQYVGGPDGGERWRHPGSDNPFSATISKGCLFVYTPNTPFPVTESGDPHGITLFRAIATLQHGGDYKAAAAALRDEGYLPPLATPVDLTALIAPATQAAEPALRLSGYLDWPEAFNADDDIEQRWLVEPVIAIGRSHALYAEAKTGKSLFVLALAAALASGKPFLNMTAHPPTEVLYCDYEMTRDDVVERLEAFGYQPDQLTHLHYALLPTGEGLDTPDGGNEVVHDATALGVQLVIVDTTARAVTGSENDADTLKDFSRYTGAQLKRRGIAVIRIDHAGKDATKGQRGTSAKNDDVDVVWRLTTQQDPGTYQLEATHRRMGWIPRTIALTLHEEPDSDHIEWQGLTDTETGWPPGVIAMANRLDAAAVPLDAGQRRTIALLKAHDGKAGKTAVIAAAIRYRRSQKPLERLVAEEGDAG